MSIKLQLPKLTELKPRITVIGVGGAGGNAVNNMIASGLDGVEFVVANTDAQALLTSSAEHVVQLGVNLTEGLGAGARPEIGEAAAEEAADEIRNLISGSHMVFIACGMGGGTGTGAASVIARVAKEMDILTVGIVTKPFQFEGARRLRIAEAGIDELKNYVDTLIVIPNQNLFRIASEKTTFAEAFILADQVLYSGIACIVDLIVKEGLINLDFADVRAIMRGMGSAMMGTGEGDGERRAVIAAEEAITNPLLDGITLEGARGLLLSIVGGHDLTLYEVDEAASRVRQEVSPDANIIVGASFDDTLGDRIRVSIVASGMDRDDEEDDGSAYLGRGRGSQSGGSGTEFSPAAQAAPPEQAAKSVEETMKSERAALSPMPPPLPADSIAPTAGSSGATTTGTGTPAADGDKEDAASSAQFQPGDAVTPAAPVPSSDPETATSPTPAAPAPAPSAFASTQDAGPSVMPTPPAAPPAQQQHRASVSDPSIPPASSGHATLSEAVQQVAQSPDQPGSGDHSSDAWQGPGDVTIEQAMPKLTPAPKSTDVSQAAATGFGVASATDGASGSSVPSGQPSPESRQASPPPPAFTPAAPQEFERSPRRMPSVEDFPAVGQRVYNAQGGQSAPTQDQQFKSTAGPGGRGTAPDAIQRDASGQLPPPGPGSDAPQRKKGFFERLTGRRSQAGDTTAPRSGAGRNSAYPQQGGASNAAHGLQQQGAADKAPANSGAKAASSKEEIELPLFFGNGKS